MTATQKKKYQSKMRRLCREAIRTLAGNHNLKVERFEDGQLQIVGPEGFISDVPIADSFRTEDNIRDFEPGFGKEKDWNEYFDNGVVLSWVHYGPPRTGDNFLPTDAKEAIETLRMIGLAVS